MSTVAVPIDVLSSRIFSSLIPEQTNIAGTNGPIAGIAFPQNSVAAIYPEVGAELYGNSSNWTLTLTWYSRSGSTTGNVTWSVAMCAITPGDATSMEAFTFATAQTVTTAVNATAKGDTLSTITITNLNSVNVGDDVFLKITRTDTSMVGDAILHRASLSYDDGISGSPGSGNVVGPASATTTAVALYNGTTGLLLQNSAVTVDASGNMAGVANFNAATTGSQLSYNGTAVVPKLDTMCANTTDQTIATTTQTALTGLSFSLPRAGTYAFRFEMQTVTLTATATEVFSVSYSGTTTGGIANAFFTTSAAVFCTASVTTFTTAGTMTSVARATVTTPFRTVISGSITVSTSGTLQLNGATGTAADNLVVKARSYGLIQEL